MTEPDVALTDLGLALECGLLAALLARRGSRREPLRSWFLLLFLSAGVAAFLGGLYHGFLLEAPAAAVEAIWLVILAAAGLTALSCWAVGAAILFAPEKARRVLLLAILLLALYLASVLFVMRDFRVVVLNSAAASLFLLTAFLAAWRRRRRRRLLWGAAGAGLMLAAGGIQQSGLDLHERYFTHNALYHVVAGIALFLIFRGATALLDRTMQSAEAAR